VVKNAIQRIADAVGANPGYYSMSKGFYTLAKAISNLRCLRDVLILAVAAVVIQVAHGGALDLFTLIGRF